MRRLDDVLRRDPAETETVVGAAPASGTPSSFRVAPVGCVVTDSRAGLRQVMSTSSGIKNTCTAPAAPPSSSTSVSTHFGQRAGMRTWMRAVSWWTRAVLYAMGCAGCAWNCGCDGRNASGGGRCTP